MILTGKDVFDTYEVKDCPFCGKAEAVDFDTVKNGENCRNFENEEECPAFEEDHPCCGVYVVCSVLKGGCGASSGFGWNYQRAVELWNKRGGVEE